jgi:hypothetical protein
MTKFDAVTLRREIAQLRRDQPRNVLTNRILDATEWLLREIEVKASTQCDECAKRREQTKARVTAFRKRWPQKAKP